MAWRELATLPERWNAPAFPLKAADFIARGIADGPALGQVLTLAEDAWLAADFPLDDSRAQSDRRPGRRALHPRSPAVNIVSGFADISVLQLLLVAGVALFASVVGGLAGYGTGALMPLVLVPLIGAEPVVPIIAISSIFTNLEPHRRIFPLCRPAPRADRDLGRRAHRPRSAPGAIPGSPMPARRW